MICLSNIVKRVGGTRSGSALQFSQILLAGWPRPRVTDRRRRTFRFIKAGGKFDRAVLVMAVLAQILRSHDKAVSDILEPLPNVAQGITQFVKYLNDGGQAEKNKVYKNEPILISAPCLW